VQGWFHLFLVKVCTLNHFPNKTLRSTRSGVVHLHERRSDTKYLHDAGMMVQGAYGKVFECLDAATGTQRVAIKLFRISPTDTDAEDVKRTAKREAYLVASLSHPNIVTCKELFWIDDKVAIVMDFVPRNLLEALEECEQQYEQQQYEQQQAQAEQVETTGKGLPKNKVQQIMLHLMKAVAFLHERDIIYRCCP
jgi:cyclin-dependent kinase-like